MKKFIETTDGYLIRTGLIERAIPWKDGRYRLGGEGTINGAFLEWGVARSLVEEPPIIVPATPGYWGLSWDKEGECRGELTVSPVVVWSVGGDSAIGLTLLGIPQFVLTPGGVVHDYGEAIVWDSLADLVETFELTVSIGVAAAIGYEGGQ